MNLTLFDAGEPTPQQAADAAIAAVRESAPVDWYAAAAKAVRDVARRQACLTTDDAQELLTSLGISEPPEPRAWGPIMRDAASEGVIRKTDRVANSRSVVCHGRPKAIWISLVME